jgi:hypothetical protein
MLFVDYEKACDMIVTYITAETNDGIRQECPHSPIYFIFVLTVTLKNGWRNLANILSPTVYSWATCCLQMINEL